LPNTGAHGACIVAEQAREAVLRLALAMPARQRASA
jgi:hypothetical protein